MLKILPDPSTLTPPTIGMEVQQNKDWNISMDKQAEICETYQLKWSSYNSYIHSCVTSSLYNDSFADVALVTTDGHQIMAHRFVLSYNSQFLAQVLKYQRKVTTTLPLMIVMPPEIDYKCLKVLVKYMYSGEAKVSKEILKSVLKGGDILQVKGLYREKEDTEKNVKITQNTLKNVSTPATTPTPPPPTPPPPPSPGTPTPTATTVSSSTPKVPDKPSQNPAKVPDKPSPIAAKTNNQQPPITNKPTDKAPTQTSTKVAPKFLLVQKPKDQQTYSRPKVLNFTIMSNFDKNGQSKEDPSKRVTILNKSLDQSKESCENGSPHEQITIKSEFPSKDGVQYLVIKDEPVEWSEADIDLMDSKEIFDDMTVKSENETNGSGSFSNEDETFSPLTCELCTETFTIPAEWVRHVQTHTDMLPAKRRRRDSTGDSYENDTFPELMCDLCQKSFPTPAEWVKHIENSHTEFELHLSNRSGPPKKSQTKNTQYPVAQGELSKYCSDCDKTFPSHASMVIHKRRHTGERPYDCDMCSKSFNVKSNLLRHLRTLHNKIINATEIENKDENSS